jgi:hypothetical protein
VHQGTAPRDAARMSAANVFDAAGLTFSFLRIIAVRRIARRPGAPVPISKGSRNLPIKLFAFQPF